MAGTEHGQQDPQSSSDLVATGKQSSAGKQARRPFRGAWTYPRTTAIAAGAVTSVIFAVSLLFIVFRTWTPLTTEPPPPKQLPATATSTALNMSPASTVAQGNAVRLTATVVPAVAVGTVQFKDGNTNIGSPVLVVDGAASTFTSTLVVGWHMVIAVFTPTDPAADDPSASPPVTFVVTALTR